MSITRVGFRAGQRKLKKMRAGIERDRRTVERIGRASIVEYKGRIKSGKDTKGRRLKALEPSTLADRRRKGITSTRPLDATGSLKESLRLQTESRRRGTRVKVAPANRRDLRKLQINNRDREVFGVTPRLTRRARAELLGHVKDEIKKQLRG